MSRSLAEINADRSRLRSKISDLTAEGEAIALRATASADGKFTDGQAERAARVATGLDRAKAELEAFDDEGRDYIRSVALNPNNVEGVDIPSISDHEDRQRTRPTGPTAAIRWQALRSVETFTRSAVLHAPNADRLDALIRDEESDPQAFGAKYINAVSALAYRSAFWKVLRVGPEAAVLDLTPQEMDAMRTVRRVDMEREAMRAMSLTGASGGFAVPFDLDPTLVGTSNGTAAEFRRVARVVTIAHDEWRGVTSGAITAAYAAEATETTDNSPTLAQPTISTEKAQAFVPFSIEIGQDWSEIQSELGGLLAESKADLEALKFTAGSGTNEPFGVITGSTNTVNATTGQTWDVEDVYRLEAALPARYWARATYMASPTIINAGYRFVGGGSTEPPIINEDRTRLLGRPLVINSEMATVTTTGTKFLLLGDFSRFVIVDRIGLTIELIPHLFGTNHRPTGQRGLYCYFRNGSKVIDANAFRVLIGIA